MHLYPARYADCMSEVELDFMEKLLNTDPSTRMTGEECLRHPYLLGEYIIRLGRNPN